jgi:hypothetical protein
MEIDQLLNVNDHSILLIRERQRKDIVVGVPHHAPAGFPKLPCPDHPDSDENAGFLGNYLSEKINCCNVIACNYTFDSNKCLRSDYSMQISKWMPKILIEIHGHSGNKTKNDIEISSGSIVNNHYSMDFAEKILSRCSIVGELKDISICGDFNKLKYRASNTATVTDNRWLAYHIELSPKFRINSDKSNYKPPFLGYKFCDVLFETLISIYKEEI